MMAPKVLDKLVDSTASRKSIALKFGLLERERCVASPDERFWEEGRPKTLYRGETDLSSSLYGDRVRWWFPLKAD